MVPKKRKTKSKRNMRRSHHALKKQAFLNCKKCSEPVLAHQMCSACGYYNGRQVIDVMLKLDKKEKKKLAKMQAQTEKTQKQEDKIKPLSMEELSKK